MNGTNLLVTDDDISHEDLLKGDLYKSKSDWKSSALLKNRILRVKTVLEKMKPMIMKQVMAYWVQRT